MCFLVRVQISPHKLLKDHKRIRQTENAIQIWYSSLVFDAIVKEFYVSSFPIWGIGPRIRAFEIWMQT